MSTLWEPPAEMRASRVGDVTQYDFSYPKIKLPGLAEELIHRAEEFPMLAVTRRVKPWLAQAFENPSTGEKTIAIPHDAIIQVYDHQFFETADSADTKEYALTKFGWVLTSDLKTALTWSVGGYVCAKSDSYQQMNECADTIMPVLKPLQIVKLFDKMKVDYTNMHDFQGYSPNQDLAPIFEMLFDVFAHAAHDIVSYLNSPYTGLFLFPGWGSYMKNSHYSQRSFTIPTHLTSFSNGMILGHGQRNTPLLKRYSWIVGKTYGDIAVLQTYDGNFRHEFTIMMRQIGAFSDTSEVKVWRRSGNSPYTISNVVRKCSLEEHVALFGPGVILDIKLPTEVENSFVKGWEADEFKFQDPIDRITIANEHFRAHLDTSCVDDDDEYDLEVYASCNEFDWTRMDRDRVKPRFTFMTTIPRRHRPRQVTNTRPALHPAVSKTGHMQKATMASKSKKCAHKECSHEDVDLSIDQNDSARPRLLQVPSTYEIKLAENFEEDLDNRQKKAHQLKNRQMKRRKGGKRKLRKNKSKILKQREIRKNKKRKQKARQVARDTKTRNSDGRSYLDYLLSPYSQTEPTILNPKPQCFRCLYCFYCILHDPRQKQVKTKTTKKVIKSDSSDDFLLKTWKLMASRKTKKAKSREKKLYQRKVAKEKRSKDKREARRKTKFAHRANAKRFVGSIAA